MSNFSVGFTTRVIEGAFLKNVSKSLVKTTAKKLNAIKTEMEKYVGEAIELEMRTSPEWFSLLDDKLRLDFGIRSPGPILEAIIDTIKAEVKCDVKPGRADILGSISITLGTELIDKLLLVKGASYDGVSKDGTRYHIPWLRWLLLEGDKLLVPKFYVKEGEFFKSRSGGAIMLPSKRTPGWGVPPEFAGTLQANWLTRSLDAVLPKIFAKFGELIKKGAA